MKRIKLGEVLDVKRGASLAGEFYSERGEKIRLTFQGISSIRVEALSKTHQKKTFISTAPLSLNLFSIRVTSSRH